jgi:hypothetical protein
MKFAPLKIKALRMADFDKPQITHVYGSISNVENLQTLFDEYLDNNTELDLRPGEFSREITLILDRQDSDSGYGYDYYLTENAPAKVRRYSKSELEDMASF